MTSLELFRALAARYAYPRQDSVAGRSTMDRLSVQIFYGWVVVVETWVMWGRGYGR